MTTAPTMPKSDKLPAAVVIAGAAICSAGRPKTRSSDKSVRDLSVNVKIKDGQIIAEQKTCGIVFSFPAAVWPIGYTQQAEWVERLTPWWDMCQADWTPKAQRLRESCRKAINKLFPTEQLLTSPSQVGGRGKRVICAAALPGNQFETNGSPRHPNDQAHT